MPRILVDTGVWYALCDDGDRTASPEFLASLPNRIAPHSVVVPWPVAYETLRTSFVRKRASLVRFEQLLRSPRVEFFDDDPYRRDALELAIHSSLNRKRPLSMVDCLLRLLMDDIGVKISYLITFNVGDFADVCARRRIEIWSE